MIVHDSSMFGWPNIYNILDGCRYILDNILGDPYIRYILDNIQYIQIYKVLLDNILGDPCDLHPALTHDSMSTRIIHESI